MEVVYEDFEAMVLFRDSRNRPAALRDKDERELDRSGISFLPEPSFARQE
jgi:hypothetical protein